MQSLNKRITEARKALGMTQEQVAEAMNVSRQTVSHWENGRVQPDVATTKQLFALLHIEIDEQPKSAPKRDAWKLVIAFLCGVLVTLAVAFAVLHLLMPDALSVTTLSSNDVVMDDGVDDAQQPLLPADYPMEWYQTPAENVAGKAYVKLTALQSPVKLTAVEDAPMPYEWNIVFRFEEINGIPFTVTRMTEVFFDGEGNVVDPWVMGSEEFAGFFQEATLVPNKQYGYNLSRLVTPDIGYGVAMEGVDANGNELAFSLYIPLSQEIEKTLTPADFVQSTQEDGKAFISMTPENDPAPLVEDSFFDGNQGWYFAVNMQNETDIPFTPDGLTLALFDGDRMYSVINMPGSQIQEWLGCESFIKDESSILYRDAACRQEITHVGLRLTGTDANGNDLAFATLIELAQELSE